eukprot:m.135158 g.135158  ORF g.135158 m.135158 type:complete len:65 (-) comp15841_c0_seq1:446-640(-)
MALIGTCFFLGSAITRPFITADLGFLSRSISSTLNLPPPLRTHAQADAFETYHRRVSGSTTSTV